MTQDVSIQQALNIMCLHIDHSMAVSAVPFEMALSSSPGLICDSPVWPAPMAIFSQVLHFFFSCHTNLIPCWADGLVTVLEATFSHDCLLPVAFGDQGSGALHLPCVSITCQACSPASCL